MPTAGGPFANWVREAWLDVYFTVLFWSKSSNDEPGTSQRIAGIMSANLQLELRLCQVQAEKNTMRDSIVEHMAREQDLRNEISSLKRHLNMAIDERDQARKRKKA